jgi:cytidylate kinase
VLADHPGLVSVAVRADRGFRIRRVMEVYGITDEVAAAVKVETSDKRRAELMKTFTGKDWNDPLLYDLCVDTGRLGLELATELVVTVVTARMRTLGERHPAPTS